MSRRTARIHAFKLIYQIEFYEEIDMDKSINDYLIDVDANVNDTDREFIYNEFSGVLQNKVKIDEHITKNLKKWRINRLNTVDIAILRLAIYEMMFMEDIPNSVSVNEAVEIAKEYSSKEAPSFINGILGSVHKDIEE